MTVRGDDSKPDSVGDPHRDLAGVLHDVSNALTVLLGWVGEARAPEATPEAVSYALTIIEQRARVARDLARHAIGSPRVDEQQDASSIARDVVEALRVEANHAGVTLVVTDGGEARAKVAGARDVSHVLTNLVLNALAHAPRGSEVGVDLYASDDTCSIVVSDHGPGVPASRRESIFRGESLRQGGTGVGLRHSSALARAAGGRVDLVDPDLPGARFRVTWPRVDAVPRPPVSRPLARELTGFRVLLVEDDVAVTQLLETALEGRGAEVTVATNSVQLSEAMREGPYHAALVDLSPIADDMTGAIARLRNSSPDLGLVLITGSADQLPETIDAEGITLVRKPFELSELLAVFAKKP